MVVMVMGVTGSGKTTVAKLLAERRGWTFADADDFHSAANKEKIHNGVALTDADRAPWLAALHAQVAAWRTKGEDAVLACSALKQAYRDTIADGGEPTVVYLKGTYEVIAERLRARHGHYAGVSILASQFATLEEPHGAITVDIGAAPAEIVAEIERKLGMS